MIFDGETEKGIQIYMQDVLAVKNTYQYERGRYTKRATNEVQIYQIDLKNPVLTETDSVLQMTVFYSGRRNIPGIHFRFTVHDAEDRIVGTGISESFSAKEGEEQKIIMKFDTESLVSGEYAVDLAVVEPRDAVQIRHDYLERALASRVEKKEAAYRVAWSRREWGSIRFPELKVERE